jgi:hypothetical protein
MLLKPIAALVTKPTKSPKQVVSTARPFTAQSCPASRRHFTTTPRPSSLKPSKHGQPLHISHPERIRPHELTRGIKPEEYESRRKKLMDSLPEGSVVVCMGGTVRLMTQGELYVLSASKLMNYRYIVRDFKVERGSGIALIWLGRRFSYKFRQGGQTHPVEGKQLSTAIRQRFLLPHGI